MAEDRKRTYESNTSLPKLKPSIGVPPLKMVLVGGEEDMTEPEGGRPDANGAGQMPASKERAVRKIIAHLQKES